MSMYKLFLITINVSWCFNSRCVELFAVAIFALEGYRKHYNAANDVTATVVLEIDQEMFRIPRGV